MRWEWWHCFVVLRGEVIACHLDWLSIQVRGQCWQGQPVRCRVACGWGVGGGGPEVSAGLVCLTAVSHELTTAASHVLCSREASPRIF